jgi:hypothetical protein
VTVTSSAASAVSFLVDLPDLLRDHLRVEFRVVDDLRTTKFAGTDLAGSDVSAKKNSLFCHQPMIHSHPKTKRAGFNKVPVAEL